MSTEQAIQPIVTGVPITKSEQLNAAQTIIDRFKNGEVEPISAYASIKAVVEALSLVLKDKDVVGMAISGVEQYGPGGTTYRGAKMSVCETGVRYNFSACGDPTWEDLSAQKAAIEAKLKERETFLRGIKEPQTIVINETGEVVTVSGPSKTSSTSVKITFAK